LIGIEAIYPKPRTSVAMAGHQKYPYLLRDVAIVRPNQVWSTDITYIPMAQGFIYLVVVLDWYSRYVLSWQLSNTLESSFCQDALQMALMRGKPDIFNGDQGVSVHSNRLHDHFGAGRDSHQHGWTGTGIRQHFHRTLLAFTQV
jgi:putative transposase